MTVQQLEDSEFPAKNARSEQHKFSHFSLQGKKIPIYCVGSLCVEENASCEVLSCISKEELSVLDALLLAQWEDRMWKGCFRYDVTASEIKVITGRIKFLAQLSEGRKMGHLEKPSDNGLHCQWDLFVFDRMIKPEELLFCVASAEKESSELIPSAVVPDTTIFVIINATPVEYGHVFLVPCSSNRLDRILDAKSLLMVTRFAAEINNHTFRVFYDCSPHSSPNKKFQGCYFPNILPVELLPCDAFFSDQQKRIHIYCITDYPIRTLLFESSCNFKMMAKVIPEICLQLQEMNMQFSLLIADCGRKIFLFLLPTIPASSTISAWECGGYFLLGSRSEFDQVTEEALLKRLDIFSLNDDDFQVVKELCCSIASKIVL